MGHNSPAAAHLQCARQRLLQSANPRANRAIRTLPLNQSVECARAHDEGIQGVAKVLMDLEGTEHTQQLATRPTRSCAASLSCATILEFTVPPLLFRVLFVGEVASFLSRPRCLLQLWCTLDVFGRHRTACIGTGRLRKRATPFERMVARIFWESGAYIRFNAFLLDMNVVVALADKGTPVFRRGPVGSGCYPSERTALHR